MAKSVMRVTVKRSAAMRPSVPSAASSDGERLRTLAYPRNIARTKDSSRSEP